MKKQFKSIMFILASIGSLVINFGCSNVYVENTQISGQQKVNHTDVKFLDLEIGSVLTNRMIREHNKKQKRNKLEYFISEYSTSLKNTSRSKSLFSGYILPTQDFYRQYPEIDYIYYHIHPSTKQIVSITIDTRKSANPAKVFNQCKKFNDNMLDSYYNKYGGILKRDKDIHRVITSKGYKQSSDGLLKINKISIKGSCFWSGSLKRDFAFGSLQISMPGLDSEREVLIKGFRNSKNKNYDKLL